MGSFRCFTMILQSDGIIHRFPAPFLLQEEIRHLCNSYSYVFSYWNFVLGYTQKDFDKLLETSPIFFEYFLPWLRELKKIQYTCSTLSSRVSFLFLRKKSLSDEVLSSLTVIFSRWFDLSWKRKKTFIFETEDLRLKLKYATLMEILKCSKRDCLL